MFLFLCISGLKCYSALKCWLLCCGTDVCVGNYLFASNYPYKDCNSEILFAPINFISVSICCYSL